jgi:hypothetical protein
MQTTNSFNPPSALPIPHSPSVLPAPPSAAPTRGRPRALNDIKRHEICALVAGGCSLREAAKYVGCGINTIRRELERNTIFRENLRDSQMHAQLSPLRTMQQAVAKHWRAAAWFLERAYPERFARRNPAGYSAPQARKLLNQVIDIIRAEINEPHRQACIVKRLRPVFEDSIRRACDSHRTSRELRQALEFFEHTEKHESTSAPSGHDAQVDLFLDPYDAQIDDGQA